MFSFAHRGTFALVALLLAAAGCQSPYAADRGALYGGVGGAGVEALVGNAVGHPGVGALVGAGVGAASGAAIGGAIDQSEARNRALIESRLGRPLAPGAVNVGDVVSMSRAGVPEQVMITQIQTHGIAAPLQTNDLILLQQQGVSPRVIQVMQTPVVPAGLPVVMAPPPQPVVYAAGPPIYGPPPPVYYRAWRPRRRRSLHRSKSAKRRARSRLLLGRRKRPSQSGRWFVPASRSA